MTRREVITKQLSWVQAAEILGISARHMRRLRRKVERWSMSAVMDQRGGRRRNRKALTTRGHGGDGAALWFYVPPSACRS